MDDDSMVSMTRCLFNMLCLSALEAGPTLGLFFVLCQSLLFDHRLLIVFDRRGNSWSEFE